MPLEELISILIIHEHVLQDDTTFVKGKSLALKTSQKSVNNAPSKAFGALDDASNDTESNYDEISFLGNKTKRMFRKKLNSSKGRMFRPKQSKEYKERSFVMILRNLGISNQSVLNRLKRSKKKEKNERFIQEEEKLHVNLEGSGLLKL